MEFEIIQLVSIIILWIFISFNAWVLYQNHVTRKMLRESLARMERDYESVERYKVELARRLKYEEEEEV